MRRRKIWLIICLTVLWAGLLVPGVSPGEAVQERQLAADPRQKYLVIVPDDYDSQRTYPLFIAVHWYQGTAEEQVNIWQRFANRDKYILLCPQFYDGYQGLSGQEDKKLIQMLIEVSARFPYDKDKVYLVGCSGGAQFVHRFAFRHPDLVTAVSMMAAGGLSQPPDTDQARRVKFLVAVGEKDERASANQEFYQDLVALGYDAKWKLFKGVGHSCGIDFWQVTREFLSGLK